MNTLNTYGKGFLGALTKITTHDDARRASKDISNYLFFGSFWRFLTFAGLHNPNELLAGLLLVTIGVAVRRWQSRTAAWFLFILGPVTYFANHMPVEATFALLVTLRVLEITWKAHRPEPVPRIEVPSVLQGGHYTSSE